MICRLSSSDMYLFLVVALSVFASILSFGNSLADFLATHVILSAMLLPTKSSVTSTVF